MRETYGQQQEDKRVLQAAMHGQRQGMHDLHNKHRQEFFQLDNKDQRRDKQLTDEQVSQQALNNIMIVANEVGRLVQWKSITLDTFLNNNFPDLTNHLKMMITTAHANAQIVENTQASPAIKKAASNLINSLEALTSLLLKSVKTINEQGESVVSLYNTVAGQAAQQQKREADLLKRALDNKKAEKNVFDRARVLIKAMGCPNAPIEETTSAPANAPPVPEATTASPPEEAKAPDEGKKEAAAGTEEKGSAALSEDI